VVGRGGSVSIKACKTIDPAAEHLYAPSSSAAWGAK
jgi:hypothetical protein